MAVLTTEEIASKEKNEKILILVRQNPTLPIVPLVDYESVCEAFAVWAKAEGKLEIMLEQLLVYFLFTYFPGAVYDGEVYAKVQMAVYLTFMIRELWMARWLKNGKNLQQDEIVDLAYRFSREVEHSDVNLKRLEKIMEKKWFL